MAVKNPYKAKDWFTRRRARIYCCIVLISSVTLGLPTALSFAVERNPEYPDDETDFEYKFVTTRYAKHFQHIFPVIVLADFLLPLLCLSVLNTLLFYEVSRTNSPCFVKSQCETVFMNICRYCRLEREDVDYHIGRTVRYQRHECSSLCISSLSAAKFSLSASSF
jgi:hypothetical protein